MFFDYAFIINDFFNNNPIMMNKLLLTFMAILLCFGATAQKDKEKSKDKNEPEITFNQKEYNFGEIEQGENVEHVFTFANSGTKPLFITNAITTCGCITAELPVKPVTKGKTGSIKIVFNSSEKIGPQNKIIIIESNALNPEERIVLKGNVLPKNKDSR